MGFCNVSAAYENALVSTVVLSDRRGIQYKENLNWTVLKCGAQACKMTQWHALTPDALLKHLKVKLSASAALCSSFLRFQYLFRKYLVIRARLFWRSLVQSSWNLWILFSIAQCRSGPQTLACLCSPHNFWRNQIYWVTNNLYDRGNAENLSFVSSKNIPRNTRRSKWSKIVINFAF